MSQDGFGGSGDRTGASGAALVAQAVVAPGPVRLDVLAGRRRLQAWFADEQVATRTGNPADTLALVLTLAAGTFEWSLEPDDELHRLPTPQTRPAAVAVEEAEALIAEARDHGWLLPSNDHLVRWSARIGGTADVDEYHWHALVAIGNGCSLRTLTARLGGELPARRIVRELAELSLVVIEEPLTLRTAVRVPLRTLELPVALPKVAAIALEPVSVEPAGAPPIVAATPEPATPEPATLEPDAVAWAEPSGAIAPAPVDDGADDGGDGTPPQDVGAAPASSRTTVAAPEPAPAPGPGRATQDAADAPVTAVAAVTAAATAPEPYTIAVADDAGWGQAPQVEDEAGWDDPAPVADPDAAWDDAPVEEAPAGWDDDVVHVEDVVGWDDLAASASAPRAAEPPQQTIIAPAAAPAAAVTPSPMVEGPRTAVAPAPPVAPKAPSAVPPTPTPTSGGAAADDDALSRAQLYQFLSSMRS